MARTTKVLSTKGGAAKMTTGTDASVGNGTEDSAASGEVHQLGHGTGGMGTVGTPAKAGGESAPAPLTVQKAPSKIDRVAQALRNPTGATLAGLGALTGWQPHSIRAALSGLRKGGHVLATSKGEDGATVYRIAAPAAPGAAPEEPEPRQVEARADRTEASS